MKRTLLTLPSAILPYIAITLIWYDVRLWRVLMITGIMVVLSAVCSIAHLICAVKEKWDSKKLAVAGLVVKLLHVPAYVFMFLFGVGMSFFFAMVLVAILLSFITVFISGTLSLSTLARAKLEGKIGNGATNVLALCSYVFFVDIIASVIMLVIVFKRKAQ